MRIFSPDKMRQRRLELGISRRALGEAMERAEIRAGLKGEPSQRPDNTIEHIEQLGKVPSATRAQLLADLLGVRIEALMTGRKERRFKPEA